MTEVLAAIHSWRTNGRRTTDDNRTI